MMRAGLFIVISLLLLEMVGHYAVGVNVQWIKVSDAAAQSVALYDIDGDGRPEIVTPGFILTGNGVLQMQAVQVIKYDFDGDGKLDLLLYRPENGQLTVFINSTSFVYSVPAGSDIRIYSGGLNIGGVLFSHRKWLAAPASARSVAPVYNGERQSLGAVYTDSGGNLKYYDGAEDRLIFAAAADFTIIDAAMSGDRVYVVLAAPLNISILISCNVSTPASARILKVIGGSITWSKFLGTSFVYLVGGTLYVYNLDSGDTSVLDTAVSRIIYPVLNPDSFAVVTRGLIKVYTYGASSPLIYFTPPGVEVYSVDVDGDILVAATSDGIYIYGKDMPTLDVSAPVTAFVYEPIAINLTGSFDYAYITVDGRRYENRSNLVFVVIDEPGVHNITVTACRGLLCVSRTVQVAVKARTMSISVSAPKSAEPYSRLEIGITVTDTSTGLPVDAVCRVRISDSEHIYAASRGRINITAASVPKGAEIPITVTCSATGYMESSVSLSIPISSYYYVADLVYTGGGVFTVRAYNNYTGEPFNGIIEAAVDGVPVSIAENKIVVSPGNHTIEVVMRIGDAVVGRYVWTVTYYSDISEVPAGQQVVVGDRVQRIVSVVTTTKTTTVPVPAVIETVNIPMAAGLFVFGLGLGLTILFLQGQIQKRRTGA